MKYLNNIVERDHRAIKRVTKPMLKSKSFQTATNVGTGIELMHMIHRNQILLENGIKLSFTKQFYALSGETRPI